MKLSLSFATVAAAFAVSAAALPAQATVLDGSTLTVQAVETDSVEPGNMPSFLISGGGTLGNPGTFTLTPAGLTIGNFLDLQIIFGDTSIFINEFGAFGGGIPVRFDVTVSGLPTDVTVTDAASDPFTFSAGTLDFSAGSDTFTFANAPTSNVPEPATLALFGIGLAGLGMISRRRA